MTIDTVSRVREAPAYRRFRNTYRPSANPWCRDLPPRIPAFA